MQAIILAGGFGTRLSKVLSGIPKPMAPIDKKPFLAFLLDYLKTQGITHVRLSLHHLHHKIQDYFQSNYNDIAIDYSIESEPLGTGGAIVNALSTMKTNGPVFVLNGDTLFKLNYRDFYQQHQNNQSSLTMALRVVEDCHRYGSVTLCSNEIVAFTEKGHHGPSLINAGVYLMDPDLFSSFQLPAHFSFEKDFVFRYLNKLRPQAFISNDYFIDIGVVDDYVRANAEMSVVIA